MLRFSVVDQVFGWGGTGPFFDLRGSLAAGELAARGGDPYEINALDAYGRPHLYSSWWLITGHLGLVTDDAPRVGVLLVAGLFVYCLASARPRSAREAALTLGVLCSPAWLLAVYRANNDLVIFLLLGLVIYGLGRSKGAARFAAVLLAGVLTVLKYYPVAAAIGVCRARERRTLVVLLGCFVAVIAIGFSSILPAIAAVAKYRPETIGAHAFGAPVLSQILFLEDHAAVGWMIGGAAALLGSFSASMWQRRTNEPTPPSLSAAISSAVLATAFASGASYTYKLIFAWWILLWLARREPPKDRSLFLPGLTMLFVASFWLDGLVTGAVNLCAPTWSRETRLHALAVLHGSAIVTQLMYWLVIGVCVWIAAEWVRGELRQTTDERDPSLRSG